MPTGLARTWRPMSIGQVNRPPPGPAKVICPCRCLYKPLFVFEYWRQMRGDVRGFLLLMALQAGQGLVARPACADEPPASQPAAPPATQPSFLPTGPPPLHLNVADLWIGMESDYEVRRVRSASPYRRRNSTQENRDFLLEEKMGITLTGDIYDPSLLDYRANLIFGFAQSHYKEKVNGFHQSDSDSGALFEWDVAADILKSKPISVHTYTRRADIRVPRRFLPSLHELQTEAGVSALALTGPVTTEVGFAYRDTETHGNRQDADDEHIRLHRFYLDSKWAISESQSLRVNFDHQREVDDYQGSRYRFHTSRDELRIEHDLAFGDRKQHRLDSYFRYNEERGTLARDELELVPRLTLQHTDKFKTIYRYGFYRFEQDAIDLSLHKFDAQALYEASKELRLSGDVFALYEHLDNDVDTNQYGVNGDVTYQKATSTGDFSVNLNLGYDQASTVGSAGRRYVRGEAHALGGVRPVVLRERNVIISTILAHDDRFTRLYALGVDYVVTRVSERIVVNRIPWGRIAEGDVVYFDYQYEVPANGEIDTYRVDFRIEHAFKFGLTPYYYYEGRFQEVDDRSLGNPAYRDNQDRHRFGARYGKDRWTVTGEYEIYDDTVEPYNAFHFTGQANLFRSLEHSLDLRSEVSRYWFEGGYDRRRVWFMDLDIRDRIQLNSFFSLTAGAELRHEDDSVRGKTRGIDVEAGLQYTRGALTVELELEYDMLSVVENRENGFGVFLNVKRDLTHIVPSGLRGGAP